MAPLTAKLQRVTVVLKIVNHRPIFSIHPQNWPKYRLLLIRKNHFLLKKARQWLKAQKDKGKLIKILQFNRTVNCGRSIAYHHIYSIKFINWYSM